MITRIKELISQLREAGTAYYKYDSPIMADRDYDQLFEELVSLEKETGIILSGSPTQKVSGEVLESLAQAPHSKPMLSAEKTKSQDEVVKFIGGKAAVVSWKLDGLTLVLRYDGGRLTQALTRGGEGGMIGEDVTHTVRMMTNVPLRIPYTGPFEVRGEGVISWANFEKINMDNEETYSHPRNLVAGSIRRLNADKTKEQMLEFFAFDLITDDESINSKLCQYEIMAQNGFSVVDHFPVEGFVSETCIKKILSFFDPKDSAYPVDGLIIEYNDLAYGKSLGATGHHENRLIALKWEDELYETTFLGLELATTRTGMVSLTGIFEDVVIDGTTVNRAYLHNLNILDSFSLGIGDRVKIYKANMIIPQLAENLTRSGTFPIPAQCPRCGSDLKVHTSEGGTRLLFCENPSCPAKLIRKFVHFCSKTRMDIPALSEKRLEIFINNGWIRNFGDLYDLARYQERIISAPGFGKKLYSRITETIERRRKCTLAQFIAGLGIPMVGRSAGRVVDRYFGGDWGAFEQAINDGFDFTQLQDFGMTMHENIHTWHADKDEEKLWRPLLNHITFIKERENESMNSNPFYGKTVVATGKLENYTRDGIQAKLLSLGAHPASTVSKNTDYLIVGEKAGSKLDKARKLGVTTLTEAQFEGMLAGTGVNA